LGQNWLKDVGVSPERLGTLAEVCFHLVNKVVDHGIEHSYEREAGRGIDLEAVENSAKEKGLLPPDQQLNNQGLHRSES